MVTLQMMTMAVVSQTERNFSDNEFTNGTLQISNRKVVSRTDVGTQPNKQHQL